MDGGQPLAYRLMAAIQRKYEKQSIDFLDVNKQI